MPPDSTPTAGATPVAEGATPSQSEPAQPATGAPPEQQQPPATGDEAQLGDAGKRALDAMKAERDEATRQRRAAEARVQELENATASDQEKAIKAARKEGEEEERGKWQPIIRQLRIEGSLRDAGCTKPALAARSPEFDGLTVDEDGAIADLESKVEAFKSANPDLFAQAKPATGDFGNGQRGGTPPPVTSLEDAISRQLQGQTSR